MKQTAVEWLVQEINKINVSTEARIFINKLEKQAKEMEKEQMEDVWHDSRVEDFGDNYIGKQKSFNDYYNETFNTEDK